MPVFRHRSGGKIGGGGKGHTELSMRLMQYRRGLASREATKTRKFPDCVGTNVFKGDCPATLEGVESAEEVHSCVICPFGGRELIEKWLERRRPKKKTQTIKGPDEAGTAL